MARRCKHSLNEHSADEWFTAACCASRGAGSMQQLLAVLVILSSQAALAVAVSGLQLHTKRDGGLRSFGVCCTR